MEKFLGFFEEEINAGLDPVDAAIKTIRKVSEMSRKHPLRGQRLQRELARRSRAPRPAQGQDDTGGHRPLRRTFDDKDARRHEGLLEKRDRSLPYDKARAVRQEHRNRDVRAARHGLGRNPARALEADTSRKKLARRRRRATACRPSRNGTNFSSASPRRSSTSSRRPRSSPRCARRTRDLVTTRGHAEEIVKSAVPLMLEIRKIADSVEIFFSSENMPYPNYRNLLSLSA